MKMPKDWIAYIKSNENEALTEIYRDFKDPFIGWVMNNIKCDKNEALDIFQVSIVILYENVVNNKIEKLDSVKSYLFAIGKNKMMEYFRSAKKNQSSQLKENLILDQYLFDESEYEIKETKFNSLNAALKEIGDPCYTLLSNFYFKKMSLDVIANEMDYKNTNTVKTKKFKCIQRLKKMVNNK